MSNRNKSKTKIHREFKLQCNFDKKSLQNSSEKQSQISSEKQSPISILKNTIEKVNKLDKENSFEQSIFMLNNLPTITNSIRFKTLSSQFINSFLEKFKEWIEYNMIDDEKIDSFIEISDNINVYERNIRNNCFQDIIIFFENQMQQCINIIES